MIEIKQLTKQYGSKTVVDHIDLTIEPGDIFAFIGHNGAGKTTTIKALMGIIDFNEGDILIDGISIKKDPLICKQKMAYIPDNPDLYEYLTGIQYIDFISNVFQVDQETRYEKVKKYATAFEMEESLGDLISSYSHGMKQKVAIIAALVHDPKILVLDEPFVGLDPKASHTIKEIMKELSKQQVTLFFSTHVLEVAEKLCNKIAIIKQGKILANGTMDEIKGQQSLENVFLELSDD